MGKYQKCQLCHFCCCLDVSIPIIPFDRRAHNLINRYFRHWLNLVMLWSTWTQFDLIPYVIVEFDISAHHSNVYRETSKQWSPQDGVWLVWWMKYQIAFPIAALQALNLFWYYLILRILVR